MLIWVSLWAGRYTGGVVLAALGAPKAGALDVGWAPVCPAWAAGAVAAASLLPAGMVCLNAVKPFMALSTGVAAAPL